MYIQSAHQRAFCPVPLSAFTVNSILQISCNTTGHDAAGASPLRRLTENHDRHMCQTYPGSVQAQTGGTGRTRLDRKIGNPSQSRQASRCTLRKPKCRSFHPPPSTGETNATRHPSGPRFLSLLYS